MFGALFNITKEFSGKPLIFYRILATSSRPGNGVDHRLAIGDLDERFRARAHDVDAIIKAEQVHIGAGVMSAQHPIHIE